MGTIVLAGGSGFLGRTLAKWFKDRNYNVVILSRTNFQTPDARVAIWDGNNLGPWTKELEGALAVINLAGRSVNCRYTLKNRKLILDSRILPTRIIGKAIQSCENPPTIWINLSTATIYKHTFDSPHDEEHGVIGASPEAKDQLSIEVAQAWEHEFNQALTPKTRKLLLRSAMVFGHEPGGVYQVLRRLTRFGLGGRMASGNQFVSWIHATDFCRSLEWLIDHQICEGVFNICAPNPLPNVEMMKIFRQEFHIPFGLPASRWMLEVGTFLLRTESELVIKSRRVIPKRLLSDGFAFNFSKLNDAISDLAG